MKVSVAMTTYNGAQYITAQLDSLRLQTRRIDELIIVDDCSTDDTVSIIETYINEWSLNNWNVFVTEENKGWIFNFYNAISKTTGDIVFFCDQDDVWCTNKIQIMMDIMLKNKGIDVLSCRLKLIDNDGSILQKNHERFPFDSNETYNIIRNAFDNSFLYTICPGCTMAIRKKCIEKYNHYINEKGIPHDALYWKIGTLLGTAYVVDIALINYRIHNENASNPIVDRAYSVKKRRVRLNENELLRQQLLIIKEIYEESEEYSKKRMHVLNSMRDFLDKREDFIKKKIRIIPYVLVAGRFYRNIKMFLGDILSRYAD